MAAANVSIESRAGDISASCLKDLRLHSIDGAVSYFDQYDLLGYLNIMYFGYLTLVLFIK